MKEKITLLFLIIIFSVACQKGGVESVPITVENLGTPSPVVTPAQTPTQAAQAPIPTQPIITPTNTPWPTDTRRPTITPKPNATWWSSLPATPNQQQIAQTPSPIPPFEFSSIPIGPDGVVIFDETRKEAWASALAPFPEWELPLISLTDSGPTEWVTVTAEFKPTRLLEINLDQDSALELALVYLLIQPDMEDGFNVSYKNNFGSRGGWSAILAKGEYGLAIFDDDDSLLWRSDLTGLFDYTELELAKVNLSEGVESLLFSRKWIGGHYHDVTYYLYSWRDSELKEYWSESVDSFAWSGSAFNTTRNRQISFRDIDEDGMMEILSVYSTKRVHIANPCCFFNYNLQFPGALVYKWQGDFYGLTYLLNDEMLYDINAQAPVTIVPYIENPIVVDGYFSDWYQVEYAIPPYENSLTYQDCSINSFPHFVWDDENLYIKFRIKEGQQVILALDSNLLADFEMGELNEDNRFLTVSIEGQGMLNLAFQSETGLDTSDIVTAVGPKAYTIDSTFPDTYPIEISIPLDQLGLADLALTNPIGWGQEDSGERFYYPTIQAVVGYATQTNQTSLRPTCDELNRAIFSETAVLDLNNPTTWGTLVFTADRGTPSNEGMAR